MTSFISRHSHFILGCLFLVIAYLLTRLYYLDLFPIFTDEAIYIRWSQIGLRDAAWRFIPLTDGKPPLYHWFMMLSLKLISDPLIAGRLVSVAAGFANLLLTLTLAHLLFKNFRLTFLSGLLYVTSPFMLIYDRLAIVDSLLTTFSLSSLTLAILLAQTLRLDVALLLGASIGLGLLTKSSGLFFLLFTPFTLFLFDWRRTGLVSRLTRWLALITLVAISSQFIYSVLRLSQFFYRIGQKNHEFILSFSEFFQSPFAFTWGNAKSLFAWQFGYLTLPVFITLILAFFTPRHIRSKLVLLSYYVVPFVIIASFNKIIFARFLLFSSPFLLILASYGLNLLLNHLSRPLSQLLLVPIVLIAPITISYFLLTEPSQAAIPQADRDQYWDSWPAGHGINQTVDYLRSQAETKPIYIGTQGTFGLMPYALEIYLQDHPNVEIHSFWPVTTIPQDVIDASSLKTTFFIYNELEDIPPQNQLDLIYEFPKGPSDNLRHMRLYQVLPQ